MRRVRCLVTAALLLLGTACASVKARDSMEQLQEAAEGYNEAYRWKNFERAAGFLPNDQRAAFVATYEDDEKSLHVEDVQILKVDMDGPDAALITVRIRYMMLPSVTVETRKLLQHWHKVNDAWILESEENSIRALQVGATPKNPEAFGGTEGQPNDDREQQIQVTDPKGNVIREQTTEEEPFPSDDP